MNREIKFRVWDEQSKLMNNEPHLDVQYGNLTSGYDCEIIMQFTGLKDKNGVDIFESDILRVWGGDNLDENNKPTDIVRIVSLDEYDMSYTCNTPLGDTCKLTSKNTYQLAVIGNTYQNPELLETVKK